MHRKILHGYEPIVGLESAIHSSSHNVASCSLEIDVNEIENLIHPVKNQETTGPKMHRFSLYWRTCYAKV
uniref:Uncharacterized protein n=1 Tax=Oryza barthii TaxID=65489 RepID=A0A0D3HTS6_9ORYZ